ncbi:helix-hairpin-helix domain-containing protein [Paraflavitalea soli]|uniref:Helix-hairpin-helix domain-containing protein n=1 Tax=Paraflavitalea soli TaxID=2315862 RepID=A0A3B7N744_9BACT|nr:helix-hairpin-helix domain-containing protein [Paraflavitalea soli]AXY77841.1 helix-hairpin-helix domain-containing protein [Paraflavitalea soli]
MKKLLSLVIVILCHGAFAQEPPPVQEQQLENQAETTEMENEDDSYWQQLESLRRHPLDLNAATQADLEALPLLNALQIANFLRYRSLLGRLVSIHELQAIPGWDVHTIRQLLPLVILGTGEDPAAPLGRRLVAGTHSLLLRASQVLEKAKGFQPPLTPDKDHYQGSPVRVFSRYRYNYHNLLQYGITADKDAGESLLSGSSKAGIDFYSFHFFARKLGKIKALALGDFTVNMGQGLIHWQSLAFKKSAAVLQVKRQGPVLRPYSAAGEYYFHRGAGITLQHKNWETTLFASFRKLDANLVNDSITSVLTSGYHRTLAELNDRQNLERITTGGNIRYSRPRWQIGFNTVQYAFSKSFKRSGAPYDIFAVEGKHWGNHSVDYSFTHRNLHIYGEAAVDQQMNKALLNGMLMSLDPKVDMALVYRRMDKDYQALQGNAFTENYLPGNEQGLYGGLSLRPSPSWQLDAYADCFRFPWLKYRVNAPGDGGEYLLQLLYKPNKGVELSSRYRHEHKPANSTDDEGPLKPVIKATRQNWRTQVMFQATPAIVLKSRVELVWYQGGTAANAEKGFAAFTEVFYVPKNSFSANMRIQFFETDSYNARIYAYEQDVQYYFSIPQFIGKGLRYYINCKQNLSSILLRKRARKVDCVVWLRLAQFLFPEKTLIGSGFDEMSTRKKTEFRLQLMLITR